MAGSYPALKGELQKGDLAGLSDAAAAAKLNSDPVVVLLPGTYLLKAGVASVIGFQAAAAAWKALTAAAALDSSGVLALFVDVLNGVGAADGIDVGDVSTRAQLDTLQAMGILQPSDTAALKAYGSFVASRAQTIPGWGVGPVSADDVKKARAI